MILGRPSDKSEVINKQILMKRTRSRLTYQVFTQRNDLEHIKRDLNLIALLTVGDQTEVRTIFIAVSLM